MTYIRPQHLFEWKQDDPDSELCLVAIRDDESVLSAYGRYAHGSGSTAVSWHQFLAGDLNDLVEKTMGRAVLQEVLEKLREIT